MVTRLLSIEYPLDVNVTFLHFSIYLARLQYNFLRVWTVTDIFHCYYHVGLVENALAAQLRKGIYALSWQAALKGNANPRSS